MPVEEQILEGARFTRRRALRLSEILFDWLSATLRSSSSVSFSDTRRASTKTSSGRSASRARSKPGKRESVRFRCRASVLWTVVFQILGSAIHNPVKDDKRKHEELPNRYTCIGTSSQNCCSYGGFAGLKDEGFCQELVRRLQQSS